MFTRDVAKMLGLSHGNLIVYIRRGRIPEPRRDRFGYFEWSQEDVERARAALATDRRSGRRIPQRQAVAHPAAETR